MQFSDLGLSPDILRAIADAGYTTPTPIQAQAVPVVLTGRDVLGCAQTGTGKTASFTLPMLEILARGRARARMPRSLILEPTRELAAQVAENFDRYGKYHKLSKALLIGGESFTDQQKALDRGVDVLIATPGRLLDLFERGKILMSDVKVLVIDEADRMLDMGFIPDVERIVSLLPKIRQTLFFSATMAPEIRRLADAFLLNPKEITVAPPASTALVTEGMTVIDEMQKREALRRLIRAEQVKNALIFCNRKRDVDILYKSLHRHGFNAAAIHGDLAQAVRTETLEKFKQGEITLLVASDVAARGLDVIGMSHVFNFDVPIHAEDYIHRIGRTGRAGREGRAFTLATPYDGKFVEAIVKLIGREIPRIEIEGIEQLPFEEGKRRGRGGERGGRERTPARGRGRERGERKHAEPRRHDGESAPRHKHQSSEEQQKPVEQPAIETPQVAQTPQPQPEAPAQVHAAPAKHRHERQARSERPERQERPARQERHRPRREAEDRDDRQTVAFGDDNTPDFLRRPVKLPPVVRKAPRAA
ncbi:MAG TPA: DEAD/DEAH box helicase [Verrucomicrobiae bacterium]|nr:DEAD/DEAH box helicase [Verrucomicrobiae bacterium]